MGYPPQPQQMSAVAGPIQYKRKYTLWILILLVIICWPAAILYYFTREKVPVQEFQTYASPAPTGYAAPGGAPGQANGPPCPKCGKPTVWVAQYGRYYCPTDQQYV